MISNTFSNNNDSTISNQLQPAKSIDEIVNQKVAQGMKHILKRIKILIEEQVRD